MKWKNGFMNGWINTDETHCKQRRLFYYGNIKMITLMYSLLDVASVFNVFEEIMKK